VNFAPFSSGALLHGGLALQARMLAKWRLK